MRMEEKQLGRYDYSKRTKDVEACMDHTATAFQKGTKMRRNDDEQDDYDWERRRRAGEPMIEKQLRDISGAAETNERLIKKLIEGDEQR